MKEKQYFVDNEKLKRCLLREAIKYYSLIKEGILEEEKLQILHGL